jgi:hypothetical protein
MEYPGKQIESTKGIRLFSWIDLNIQFLNFGCNEKQREKSRERGQREKVREDCWRRRKIKTHYSSLT